MLECSFHGQVKMCTLQNESFIRKFLQHFLPLIVSGINCTVECCVSLVITLDQLLISQCYLDVVSSNVFAKVGIHTWMEGFVSWNKKQRLKTVYGTAVNTYKLQCASMHAQEDVVLMYTLYSLFLYMVG